MMNKKQVMISFVFMAMATTIAANPLKTAVATVMKNVAAGRAAVTTRATAFGTTVSTQAAAAKAATLKTVPTVVKYAKFTVTGVAVTGLTYAGYKAFQNDGDVTKTTSSIKADLSEASSFVTTQAAKVSNPFAKKA